MQRPKGAGKIPCRHIGFFRQEINSHILSEMVFYIRNHIRNPVLIGSKHILFQAVET